jgi:hypothetical protein
MGIHFIPDNPLGLTGHGHLNGYRNCNLARLGKKEKDAPENHKHQN